MGRLTWKNEIGDWGLCDIPWENLRHGAVIDDLTWRQLYGALWKLLDYEDTGMEPAEVIAVNSFEKTQTAKLLGKLAEEREKHRWIPVEERLPEKGERIIVCTEHGFRCEAIMMQSGKYFRYGIENEEIFGQKIVAWMPLPEPYRQEEMKNNG